jgi:hypothetical protein
MIVTSLSVLTKPNQSQQVCHAVVSFGLSSFGHAQAASATVKITLFSQIIAQSENYFKYCMQIITTILRKQVAFDGAMPL